MLAVARAKAPDIDWYEADLSDQHGLPDGSFDLILLAGNVMIFLDPGTEDRVLVNLVSRLAPGGMLVSGFSLHPDQLSCARYDAMASSAGLAPLARWSTWDRRPFADGDYAVSVHRREAGA